MPRALQDAPYKLLFSSPRMVADLIRGFIPDPWLARFDPATLVPAPTVLIDIQRLTLQQLDRLDSVLALLMRFELRHHSEDMMHVMARLDHQIARQDPLRETIRTWALAAVGESSSLAPLLDEFVNVKGTAMSFKENVEAYFAKRDRLARDQGMRAGLAEGKLEGQRLGQRLGQREGRIKGQAEILSRQIARRFGPLDEATQNRLASAKPAMLQR